MTDTTKPDIIHSRVVLCVGDKEVILAALAFYLESGQDAIDRQSITRPTEDPDPKNYDNLQMAQYRDREGIVDLIQSIESVERIEFR